MQPLKHLYSRHSTKIRTLGIATGGTLVYGISGLPLPFLFGPMISCLLVALMGGKLQGFNKLASIARTVLGVAIGASITPQLFSEIPVMLLSMALIPVYLLSIGVIGIAYFRWLCRFDPVTAYYAAMPGGLQDMVVFGIESGGNGRALSLIHATRIMLVVITAPIFLHLLYEAELTNSIGASATDIPINELVLMLVAAIVGWRGAKLIGLFGASLLGPMIVTTIFSLTGLIHFRPPAEMILFAQFFIGIGIGVLYVGITLYELRRIVLAGIGYAFILAILAAAYTYLVTAIGDVQGQEVFMAFAPGGQAEMTLLAIVAGADSGYVIAHHIVRLVLVISFAPIVAKLLKQWLFPVQK